jgi:hypothetical protein
MSTRRFISLAGATLGAAALLLSSAVGSHAQVPPGTINLPNIGGSDGFPPISDVLAFSGQAVITSDNAAGLIAPCLSAEPDNPPEVDIVGCGGTFGFTTTACAGVSDPDPDLPAIPSTVEAGLCSIAATGSFQNLICGTGTVQGAVTITGGADAGEAGTFGIVFAATVGVVTGYISGDYVVGVVQLGPPLAVPPPPNPNDPDCTGGFTVTSVDLAFDL